MEQKLVAVAAVSLLIGTALTLVGSQTTGLFDQVPGQDVVYLDSFHCGSNCNGQVNDTGSGTRNDAGRFTPGEDGYRLADGVEIRDMNFLHDTAWTIEEVPGENQPSPKDAGQSSETPSGSKWRMKIHLPDTVRQPSETIVQPLYRLDFFVKTENFEEHNAHLEFDVDQVVQVDGQTVEGDYETCWEYAKDTDYSTYAQLATFDHPECAVLHPGVTELSWTVYYGDYNGTGDPPTLSLDDVRIEVTGTEGTASTYIGAIKNMLGMD